MADDRDALAELGNVSDVSAVHLIRHYLYLPSRQTADSLVSLLNALGIVTDSPFETYDGTWLIRATTSVIPTDSKIAELRSVMQQAANENGGEYDGWEAEVLS